MASNEVNFDSKFKLSRLTESTFSQVSLISFTSTKRIFNPKSYTKNLSLGFWGFGVLGFC